MTILVQSGQTIFDIALLAYNDASKAYDLITENPELIDNINSDISGLTLFYTPSAPSNKKEATKLTTEQKKNVTIQSTQTLFDLALQYYGAAENIYQLIEDNSFLDSVLSTDYVGKNLNYTLNKGVVATYYRNSLIDVSTKLPYFDIPGINYLLQESGYYLLQENGDKLIL